MDMDRLDLRSLGAGLDADRFEQLVRNIAMRAAPELARRGAATSPIIQLTAWLRPALAAAAMLGLVSSAALFTTARGAADGVFATASESMETVLPDWLMEMRAPTVAEVMIAFDGDWQ